MAAASPKELAAVHVSKIDIPSLTIKITDSATFSHLEDSEVKLSETILFEVRKQTAALAKLQHAAGSVGLAQLEEAVEAAERRANQGSPASPNEQTSSV